MTKYITDLTDYLIASNRFFVYSYPDTELVRRVKERLECGELAAMNTATHGRILGELAAIEFPMNKNELFSLVTFSGNCGNLLLQLTATCLAHVILARFRNTAPQLPQYQRRR